MATELVSRGEIMDYVVKIFYGKTVADPAQFLKAKGITNGSSPEKNVNRAEMVVFAYRAAKDTGYFNNIKLGVVDTPPPAVKVTTTLGDSIVNRATPEIGRKVSVLENGKYIWADNYTYCARFVRAMFGKHAKWSDAKSMCNAYKAKGLIQTSGKPTKGSVICYSPDKSNGNYGHIAIAKGDGLEIGATNLTQGITQRTIRSTGYQGWIKAEDYNNNY
jgi:hypothetical protein